MPIEWKLENNNLALFHVTGQLGKDEYDKIQSEIESIINKVGRIRILVVLEDFKGWQSAKGWEQSDTETIDHYIVKMAIVGDEKWRDLVTVFTLKGLRPVPIEYFASNQLEFAQ